MSWHCTILKGLYLKSFYWVTAVFYFICRCFLWQDRENAQSSCAGLFIGSHLGFDWPGVWVHVDIASPVHAVSTDRFGVLTDAVQSGFVLSYDYHQIRWWS